MFLHLEFDSLYDYMVIVIINCIIFISRGVLILISDSLALSHVCNSLFCDRRVLTILLPFDSWNTDYCVAIIIVYTSHLGEPDLVEILFDM